MERHKKPKKDGSDIRIGKKVLLAVVIIILLAIAGYLVLKKTRTAQLGDTVVVDYTLMLEGKKVADTSIEGVARAANIYNPKRDYTPINITIGAGKFLPGLEDALFGMKEGEQKTVTLPPERAYGQYDPKKIASVNRSLVKGENLTIGSILRSGDSFYVVKGFNETTVLLDMNSPLAGKTLTFDIKVIRIIRK